MFPPGQLVHRFSAAALLLALPPDKMGGMDPKRRTRGGVGDMFDARVIHPCHATVDS